MSPALIWGSSYSWEKGGRSGQQDSLRWMCRCRAPSPFIVEHGVRSPALTDCVNSGLYQDLTKASKLNPHMVPRIEVNFVVSGCWGQLARLERVYAFTALGIHNRQQKDSFVTSL